MNHIRRADATFSTRYASALLAVLVSSGLVVAHAAAPPPALPELTVTPDRKAETYAVGDTVGWSFARAPGASRRDYHFTVRRNGLTPVAAGQLSFAADKARIALVAHEPEMLYVEITASDAPKAPLLLGAAVAPQQLQPSLPGPADFDSFWKAKLKWLKSVPANPLLDPSASGNPDVDYATITMATVDGAHIHGQIARPRAGNKFPALLILQYAGGPYPLQKQWVVDRAAQGWLALNVEPHDVLPVEPQAYYDKLPARIKQYQAIGRDSRDRSYFLRMYLSDYRAVEYLASRKDWDGHTLVLLGTSMGGQQSLCTAALNHRVTAVIVNEPSGADANGEAHGRLTGYPNWPADDPRALHTAPYFDTVNCASRIRAPTLVAMGFTDTTAPPTGIWTAFNQIPGPKEAVPMVDSPHNNYATPEQQRPFTDRSEQWLQALRTGGAPSIPAR
jgi:cephalosporin-C deacetylase-like acetyl esterase